MAKAICNGAHNEYTSTLHCMKVLHWKSWLESITEADIWHAGRFATSNIHDGSAPVIPYLYATSPSDPSATQEFSMAEDKCKLFTNTFFLPKPPQVPSLPDDNGPFPPPRPFVPPSLVQVHHCILKLCPHKAPGPDKIPNVVLCNTIELVALLLHHCLLAILSLKYFPSTWCSWLTVVLQKPNRPNYIVAKAYRPIALYNTMDKVVSAIITDMLIISQSTTPCCCPNALVVCQAIPQRICFSTLSTTSKMPVVGRR